MYISNNSSCKLEFAGITATVVGGTAATMEAFGATAKWVGRTGRAASIIGLVTLGADAYISANKKQQTSKVLKTW